MLFKDLKIQINGLNETDSTILVEEITALLKKFNELDLRRLDSIIITENFERDIEKITSPKSAIFKNRYSSQKQTLAKVLTLPTHDDFKFILIMRASYAINLLKHDDNLSIYRDAVHVFHHELGHIHDNNNKIDKFKDQMKNSSYKGKQSIFYPIAEVCWSEYIANYLSSSSAQESLMPEMVANSLEVAIREKEQRIKTEVMAFKANKTRTDLLHSIKDDIESLLKTACYVIGYMHGMNKTLEELSYDSDYFLECSYFKDIWEVLIYELNSMIDVYPNGWINLNIYQPLAFSIEAFFNQMGVVVLQDDKEEVYFRVM